MRQRPGRPEVAPAEEKIIPFFPEQATMLSKPMKTFAAALAAAVLAAEAQAAELLVIAEQGSYAVGGSSVKHEGTFSSRTFLEPQGQSAYGDHAYVFYQIPQNARAYPIVMQHGGAQSKRTWESTPDGREGFANIFLRKGYGVYLLDQPRMGEAGLSTKAADAANPYAHNPMYADKALYMLSRVGTFKGDEPVPFANAAVPRDAASYDQFQRTWTPYTGPIDNDLYADVLAKVFKRTGEGILFTHSMGGTVGWRAAMRTGLIKAIVAFEPGGTPFVFPEGEVPKAEQAVYPPVSATAEAVPLRDFMALTRIPIVIYYGDNIADKPTGEVGPDKWRTERDMAEKFVAAVNRHGGRAELVRLPDIGIRGNTHFVMADTNNREVADLVARWLDKNGLALRR
jgi:pimeloyl-ACP methyl ester carboxylesterase